MKLFKKLKQFLSVLYLISIPYEILQQDHVLYFITINLSVKMYAVEITEF